MTDIFWGPTQALQRCNHLTSSLSSLARQRPTTKFIQVQADVIDFGGGDHDVLPTILVYKHGDLVANLVRIDLDQQWGKGEERDVERVIKRCAARTPSTQLSASFARSHSCTHTQSRSIYMIPRRTLVNAFVFIGGISSIVLRASIRYLGHCAAPSLTPQLGPTTAKVEVLRVCVCVGDAVSSPS